MQKIQRDFKIIDCALLTTQTIILIEFYNFFDSTIIRYLRIYTQSLTFGNRMESKTSYDSMTLHNHIVIIRLDINL